MFMNKCLQCGKDTKSKFCSKSCAAKYNNVHRAPMSVETKQKISSSVKQTAKLKYELTPQYRCCVVCGKIFERPRLKSGRLSYTKVCSDECHLQLKIRNGKQSYEKIKSEGRFKGWQSRNITSYPERFWKQVLDNNNIPYKFNYHFDKYFLDFYIEIDNRKIDLEIDGKQHKYEERLESDKVRDEFVKSQNIEVYRIDWNEINSDKGKILMKTKIDDFIKYIKLISNHNVC